MRIEVTNQQARHPLDEAALARYAHWIMEQVQDLAPHFHWVELSLVLTDDSIRALNREWCGRDKVTDVISFAYPDDDGFSGGDTGEIIVNVQQAAEEGRLRESPDDELALYIAHGCHHLMGAEDHSPDRKRAMLTLERAWLENARALGLCGPFFQ
jgi:rRNA maturation RNase YbeY